MQFNTLNNIIDDIMLEIRDNNIAESERLSRVQLEQWILQYRSVLIKQDIDRGRDMNPMYIQEFNGISIVPEDYGAVSNNSTRKFRWKTSIKIPKTIDFHNISGIINVTDIFGHEIQFGTEGRSNFQEFRKYTNNDYTCYLKGQYLYVEGPGNIELINIRGIFEDPSEVNPSPDFANERYPIPSTMLPTLKTMIIDTELRLYATSDTTMNSKDDTDPTDMLVAARKAKRARGAKYVSQT